MKQINREKLSDILSKKIKKDNISLEAIAVNLGITKESVRNGISQTRSCSNAILIKIAGEVGFYLEVVETPSYKYYNLK